MAYITTVPETDAPPPVAELYDADRAASGYVPNYTKAFSLRPAAYRAWRELNGSIKGAMDPRRYELATLAAARRLRSSYCMLAHGSILAAKHLDPATVRALAADDHASPPQLSAAEVAVMDLADKVAADATSVTEADVELLRRLGLSDADIADVVLAAAARCFFAKVLDGLGVQPDAQYAETMEPDLRDALAVGRPIADE
jgi:uncharacterized peroxidase-related enzyme